MNLFQRDKPMATLRRHTGFCGIVLAVALLVAGCASQQDKSKTAEDAFFEEWRARAAESKGYIPRPQTHLEEPLAEGAITAPRHAAEDAALEPFQKALPDRKISMKMKDVDVSVLLRALARVADQNIMLNQKVAGQVNININEAPWNQVFESLLLTHGLTYTWEGDIIRVMTVQDMETELRRESQKQALEKVEPLVTRVVKVNYAPAAKMRTNLERFLSEGRTGQPLGSVMVDEHTNSLIIQAIPSDIRQMVAVLNQIDRPTSQILIEAHIVETTNDTARALGVQWGGVLFTQSNGKNWWMGPNGVEFDDTTLFDEDTGEANQFQWPAGNISNFPVNLQDNIGLSLGFLYQNIGNHLLSFQLQALQDEGKLNILSSPSITTLENQAALIESGSRIPIQTVENGEVNIEYVQATLRLEVTPNLTGDQALKLKIMTNKDEPDFSRTVAGNPTIVTKRAETNVVLFNGQTTVIGGLSRESNLANEAGIPYLKDVPGLGWLFGNRTRSNQMEEVLIFITPYVLEERPIDQAGGVPARQPASAERPQQ
jgi:type IV pilus assembly protein PilQ